MKIRFYNARVLTMEPGKEIFKGEVWIEDERYVLQEKQMKRMHFTKSMTERF